MGKQALVILGILLILGCADKPQGKQYQSGCSEGSNSVPENEFVSPEVPSPEEEPIEEPPIEEEIVEPIEVELTPLEEESPPELVEEEPLPVPVIPEPLPPSSPYSP